MVDKPDFSDVSDPSGSTQSLTDRTRTTNEAGGTAFESDDSRVALYKVCLNNLLESSYYDSVEESFDKIWDAYDATVESYPEFPLQLAAHARNEEGLRDVPQLLLVLAANDDRVVQPGTENSLIRDYTPAIIDRTDEFRTVVSYQLDGFGKPIPNGLTQGLRDALHQKYAIVQVKGENGEELGTERVTFIEQEYDSFVEYGEEELGGIDAMNGQTTDIDTTHRARDRAHARAIESATDIGEFAGTSSELDEGYVHDEYTFTKYQGRDADVSLQDVLNLVRPKPRSEERNVLFESLMKGELDSGNTAKDHWTVEGNFPPEEVEPLREDRTWESELSEDDDRTDAEKFRERIDDMGLMARTRNLRSMLGAGLSGDEIFDYDGGEFGPESRRRVLEHQQFPFRYYQAYKACADDGWSRHGRNHFTLESDILDDTSEGWLNGAIDAAAQNLPDTLEDSFTIVDLSGSMDRSVSNDSDMARAEIATLLGSSLAKRDSDIGVFGDTFAYVDIDAVRSKPTLELAEDVYGLSEKVGNSTNGHKAIQWATRNEKEYDQLIVFTDEQLWDSTSGLFGSSTGLKEVWDDYVQQVNPNAQLIVVDLASYGTFSMPEGYDNVLQLSGWSDNVLEFIDKYDRIGGIVDDIQSIEAEQY
jgi:hypothetical protein